MPRSTSVPVRSSRLHAGGDHMEQLEALHRAYYNPLLAYGLAITGHRSWVKDAIHDLFLYLLDRPERFDQIANWEAYLFSALRRNLRGRLSSRQSFMPLNSEADNLAIDRLRTPAADVALMEEEALAMRQAWVSREVGALPERLREALYLRYMTKLAYREIAEVMAIEPQVAKNFVSRALKRLRRRLKAHPQALISFLFVVLLLAF